MNEESLEDLLNGINNLPSATELEKMISETEVRLFTQQSDVSEELIKTGWYLFSIATARLSLDLYTWPKQRMAYQLAGHIFDLALTKPNMTDDERLSMAFAAQIGYMRGELNPNAIAIYKKAAFESELSFSSSSDLSLKLGVMFLAQDRKRLFPLIQSLNAQINILGGEDNDLLLTRNGGNYGVVKGIWHLLLFLTNGPHPTIDRIAEAVVLFTGVTELESRYATITTRWVAANLINISDDLTKNSIWKLIPPEIPSSVATAMSSGTPPIFSLWPPQVKLLNLSPSPLLTSTQRLIVSFPTNAGKTLIAQLFIMSHLEQQDKGVCFVVPTHSLAREVRLSLRERLRFIGATANVVADTDDWDEEGENEGTAHRVDVMTPEKLSSLLKNRPEQVLDKYSLFVIDEAHIIGDSSRGWVVEGIVTFLKALTAKKEHRIILMSALLGNRAHLYSWLANNISDMPQELHSDWRGPRRLYAIYNSVPEWGKVNAVALKSGTLINQYPLFGEVHLKTGINSGSITALRLKAPVGILELDMETKKKIGGTPFYQQLIPLIRNVGRSGPILVIETTKVRASSLALALADSMTESHESTQDLADFISLRVGDEHPLVRCVRKGVAFHHGSLPTDIQGAIEDAVKEGAINYIVATTTLTEGVNLPVRTVLIAEQGVHMGGGDYNKFLSGPKLLNAIGRAGRAGKESDGWIILAVNRQFDPAIFSELTPLVNEQFDIKSLLTTEDALKSLQWYEEARKKREDLIFKQSSPEIFDQFVSYIWFLGTAFEEMSYDLNFENVSAVLSHSLAWEQMNDANKESWMQLAENSFQLYEAAPEGQRKRWAKTGVSLPNAAQLENIKDAVVVECLFRSDENLDAIQGLELLVGDGRLESILALKGAPSSLIRINQNSSKGVIINSSDMLFDWVSGVNLKTLGEKHLPSIKKIDFMFEQLSVYTSTMLEHYVPWLLGTIITWVNNELEESGFERMLDAKIPQYVHYGVNTSFALELLKAGMKSRRLANSVAHVYIEMNTEEPVIQWLRKLSLSEWRELFTASPLEVRELYECVRVDGLIREVLSGDGILIEIDFGQEGEEDVLLKEKLGAQHPIVSVFTSDGEELGPMPAQYQTDVRDLLQTGIPLSAKLMPEGIFINKSEFE